MKVLTMILVLGFGFFTTFFMINEVFLLLNFSDFLLFISKGLTACSEVILVGPIMRCG